MLKFYNHSEKVLCDLNLVNRLHICMKADVKKFKIKLSHMSDFDAEVE